MHIMLYHGKKLLVWKGALLDLLEIKQSQPSTSAGAELGNINDFLQLLNISCRHVLHVWFQGFIVAPLIFLPCGAPASPVNVHHNFLK